MIHRRKRQVGAPDRQPFLAQQCECLGRRYLMNQVEVDIQDCWRIGRLVDDDMLFPDLVEKRFGALIRSSRVPRRPLNRRPSRPESADAESG